MAKVKPTPSLEQRIFDLRSACRCRSDESLAVFKADQSPAAAGRADAFKWVGMMLEELLPDEYLYETDD